MVQGVMSKVRSKMGGKDGKWRTGAGSAWGTGYDQLTDDGAPASGLPKKPSDLCFARGVHWGSGFG